MGVQVAITLILVPRGAYPRVEAKSTVFGSLERPRGRKANEAKTGVGIGVCHRHVAPAYVNKSVVFLALARRSIT